jgi:predicted dehydrogenase
VLLTVLHNRRWDGDLRTLQRLLDADALGSVHRFESRFERWRPAPRPGAWRELERPEAGGGLLLDLGSHLVDQALLLFGQPRSVYAEVDRRRAGVQGDDDVFIALEHPGGVRSHLWASSLAAQVGPRLRVLGNRGAYVKHGLDVQEELMRAGSARRSRGGAVSHSSAGAGWASTESPAASRPSLGRTSCSTPGWLRRLEAAGFPRSIPAMPLLALGSSRLPGRAPPAEQRYGCDGGR